MWLSGTWWRCVKNVQFNISCDLWPHMSSSSTRQSIIRLILSGIQLPVMALQGTCLKAIMSNSIWLLRLEWKLDLDSMAKSAEDTGRLKLYSLCDFFFSLLPILEKRSHLFTPKNIYIRGQWTEAFSKLVVPNEPVPLRMFSVVHIAAFGKDTFMIAAISSSLRQRGVLVKTQSVQVTFTSGQFFGLHHFHEDATSACFSLFFLGYLPCIQELQVWHLMKNEEPVSLIVIFIVVQINKFIGTGYISKEAEVLKWRDYFSQMIQKAV